MRIGIDVGGTHTDAALVEGDQVIDTTKARTTADVRSGVLAALDGVLSARPGCEGQIEAVMLGTTQFTNAVVERRELSEVAAIRIGLPSGQGLEPKCDWPADISRYLGDQVYMLHGGTLYDGWPQAEMREPEIELLLKELRRKNTNSVCISATFSPMNPQPEIELAQRVRAALPGARITLSHQFGSLGLLERENAALLNASLLPFADQVVSGFVSAMRERGLESRFYISQNDGTLMESEFARTHPALTFASGPTNSLRGACKLSGLEDAIVIDIGGTTSDIGVLQNGFPRTSNLAVDVGGVRTNFRMPDILALPLGGGTLISGDGSQVGPRSLGHRLFQEGVAFGGGTLSATDIMIAAGVVSLGEPQRVSHLTEPVVRQARASIQAVLNAGIERVKTQRGAAPAVLVGGGSFLAEHPPAGVSHFVRPEHAGVANAIGAAIAQIGGECERLMVYANNGRDAALAEVTAAATQSAVEAGADPATIMVADVEETPMAYTAEPTARVRVKVVGDLGQVGLR